MVAEVLKLAKLGDDDGVPEMQVGCCGVHAELYAQRPAAPEPVSKLVFDDQFVAAALDDGKLIVDRDHLEYVADFMVPC